MGTPVKNTESPLEFCPYPVDEAFVTEQSLFSQVAKYVIIVLVVFHIVKEVGILRTYELAADLITAIGKIFSLTLVTVDSETIVIPCLKKTYWCWFQQLTNSALVLWVHRCKVWSWPKVVFHVRWETVSTLSFWWLCSANKFDSMAEALFSYLISRVMRPGLHFSSDGRHTSGSHFTWKKPSALPLPTRVVVIALIVESSFNVFLYWLLQIFQCIMIRWSYLRFENLMEWACYITSILLVIDVSECSFQTGLREVM